MKKDDKDENNDEIISDDKHKSIDYTLYENVSDGKQETNDDTISDELREAIENMPEPIYSKEEKFEITPFPIRDGNDLRRSRNQYRCYSWVLSKLPIKEHKLTTLMNFMFNRQRKESYPIVKQLLVLEFLRKVEDGFLIPTIDFVNYVKDLYVEIEKYEKENQK